MELKKEIEYKIKKNIDIKDSTYLKAQDLIWIILNETHNVISDLQNGINISELTEQQLSSFIMFGNCFSDLIASKTLIVKGFQKPTAVILRSIVENISMAIAVYNDTAVFEKYKVDEYDIPKSVSIAKRFFPELGLLNGILSNDFTHEPYKTIGRSIISTNDSFELVYVPAIDGHNYTPVAHMLISIGMISITMGQAIESCFCNYLSGLVFGEKVDGSQILFRSDCLANKSLKELSGLLS